MSDSKEQKPVGYGHDQKGAAGGAAYGAGKPGVAHTAPADKSAGAGGAILSFTVGDGTLRITQENRKP